MTKIIVGNGSKKYVQIDSDSKNESERQFILASEPTAKTILPAPREENIKFYAIDGGDRFYVRTNWQTENFRLMEIDPAKPERKNWKDTIPARGEVYLERVLFFNTHLVLFEQVQGMTKIRLLDRASGESYIIPTKDSIYKVWVRDSGEAESSFLRFNYSSLSTPTSVIDIDFKTHEQKVRKEEVVRGGFASKNYVAQRFFATAPDGAKVPMALVYKNTVKPNKNTPLLIYAYGAYGYPTPPIFDANIVSLLDCGFVYVSGEIPMRKNITTTSNLIHPMTT
jgi:oligopeptidase B